MLITLFLATFLAFQKTNEHKPKTETIILSMTDTSRQQHMTFKGVPIDGPYNSFLNTLKEKGFNNETGIIVGQFAGKDVSITLKQTPITKTVYSVTAEFQEHAQWNKAWNDYYLFKNNLETIYGQAFYNEEQFLPPYNKDDGYSIRAHKEGKANFISIWVTEKGTITCSISYTTNNKVRVELTYCDQSNEDIATRETELIIKNDL